MNFLYAEINVVGIILLLLFLNNMNRNGIKAVPFDQYLFNGCIVMNIFIFLFDTGMWLVDGLGSPALIVFNYVVTTLYYISSPLICFVWLVYTDYKIHESKTRLEKRIRFYIIPAIVSAILSIASLQTGWFFVIDASNQYMRGSYFSVMAGISFVYLLFAFGMALKDVIKNGWGINRSINIHLAIFPLGIIMAAVFQVMYFGISIIWVCAMLAFASIYINIQNGEISTDHLTGLYNRRRLDEHLQRRLKMRKREHHLFAMILDLDNFKSINDQYGHAVGDDALMKMAELLRKSCQNSDDFVARIGGDEFIIIGERKNPEEIQKLSHEISREADVYNQQDLAEYEVLPSIGYSIFSKEDSIDSLLATADQAMYRNKQERKRFARIARENPLPTQGES